MPKLDGLGVLEKIKKDKELTKVPAFIVISAIAQERVTENAFELGAKLETWNEEQLAIYNDRQKTSYKLLPTSLYSCTPGGYSF